MPDEVLTCLQMFSADELIPAHPSHRDHPSALPNYERRGFRRYPPDDGPSPEP